MSKSTQRLCCECGAPLSGRGTQRFCSTDCKPQCSVDGCHKTRKGSTYCSAHHSRWKRTGDPLTPVTRTANVGPCSVAGCEQPMRKKTWCASHYSQWRRIGEVKPFTYKWSDFPNCIICDKPNGIDLRSRKVCSPRCQQLLSRHGGVPPNPACARCGIEVDLTAGKAGRRKRADTKLCHRCRVQHRTEATPGELALRDGPFCQLCGCDVDLLAVFPDKMRPSVDHIIPRAWGGSDAASNNQLTHLLCNQTKSDRYEGVSSRTSP